MSENARFKSVSEMIREVSEDPDLARDVERRIEEPDVQLGVINT